MELINILSPLITLILGGGIVWIFTIKYTRKQAEADAMQHFQTVYQGLISDLKEDRTSLREEVSELKKQQVEDSARIRRLEEGQRENSNVIRQLARMACVKAPACVDCVLIDISKL